MNYNFSQSFIYSELIIMIFLSSLKGYISLLSYKWRISEFKKKYKFAHSVVAHYICVAIFETLIWVILMLLFVKVFDNVFFKKTISFIATHSTRLKHISDAVDTLNAKH